MSEKQKKRLSLKLKEVLVDLELSDAGNGEPGWVEHKIVELRGCDRDKYLDHIRKHNSDPKTDKLVTMAQLMSTLLCLSLVNCATGKKVDQTTIENFPASVQAELFQMTQELNGLGPATEKALEEAKND